MKEIGHHLTGKVAWVTGSSRGIGRVIATHLAISKSWCFSSNTWHNTLFDSRFQ